MIEVDPLAIATGGYWNKYSYTDPIGVATDGYIIELVLAAITIPTTGRDNRPIIDLKQKRKDRQKELLKREEDDILAVIKIFMEIWDF